MQYTAGNLLIHPTTDPQDPDLILRRLSSVKLIKIFLTALKKARGKDRTTVICIQNDRYVGVPGYESWWDVAVAEVSEIDAVQKARVEYETAIQKERYFL